MDYFAKIRDLGRAKYLSEETALKASEPFLTEFRANEEKILARARKYLELIVKQKPNLVQSLIAQYPLKTEAGYAIMSLAESLARVPDRKTAYKLIDDKISKVRWESEGGNPSLVMNTVAQALKLASKIGGNAVTYAALSSAFKILAKEFILGDDIEAAHNYAKALKREGFLLSYDMLGEAARTSAQAAEYLNSYLQAAENAENHSGNIFENDSISVKLSALHPRFELLKYEQLRSELLPNLAKIIAVAKARNIAVTIDAEEANQLDLTLLLFSELYLDSETRYHGLGLAAQAYQRQTLPVLEYLKELAQKTKTRIPVRLVKGAYWDYEIKKAQADGLADYPVFTKKEHTDLSYLAAAKFLLGNPANFYPQFGTHNVMTIAAILEIGTGNEFEFQKLYGMGDEIYEQILPVEKFRARIYAPVGEQKDLLAYLIRRLLENGANNSFINQLTAARKNFNSLLSLPFNNSSAASTLPPPANIFNNRKNSKGYNLGSLFEIEEISESLTTIPEPEIVAEASLKDCEIAVKTAAEVFSEWNERGVNERAEILEEIADSFEQNTPQLLKLLMSEAKRNLADSLSEIREAVDFCRYYAVQARTSMLPHKMQSITGEENIYQLEGRGVFICISPWNFPLSIFTGQITAALAVGNCVIAKPAAQTPKIAKLAVELMHAAGVPEKVLQLIIGSGSKLGGALVANPKIAGVCLTGSTATARLINKSLAENNQNIVPFIAETGGQNCMIVDSTALIERTVDDIIISAFGSAGQRCSALRVAYIQEEIFTELTETLKNAMQELEISAVENFSSDVGEVIDKAAKAKLLQHIEKMKKEALLLYAGNPVANGNFVPPHIFEIKSIQELPEEIFGPILHIIHFNNLEEVIEEINSTGYGLTFGIQTRIASRVDYLAKKIKVGNVYANRSMIGAVVESQPFGGHGLSGSGPKAGGPEYLKRFCVEKVITNNKTAIGGNIELL